jgi:Rrf2 family protein
MVRLSAKTEYALRAMLDLAEQSKNKRTTLPAIAERQGMPRKFLPMVLESLIQARLVHSTRGFGGGVELACEPSEVTIRQIIESVDGPQQLYSGNARGNEKEHPLDSGLRNVLDLASQAMLDVLEKTTLGDLLDAQAAAAKKK